MRAWPFSAFCLYACTQGRDCQCRAGFTGDGESCSKDVSQSVFLQQKDFDEGTYIISQPGRYVLAENITFNPNPRSAGGFNKPRPDQFTSASPPGKYDRRAYALGFFAAIAITAGEVDVDLNGFTIEQSVEHALMQRFYAAIELANAPFHYDQGPHNFTSQATLQSASNTRIHNGYLGRSSHHGIHGHGNRGIVLSRLSIYDFEVAGISMNGGIDVVVEQVVIGPSRTDVPVLGLFSTGVFILPYVEQIISQCPDADITLDGIVYTGAQVAEALYGVMNQTYDSVVCGVGSVPPVVNNMGLDSIKVRRNGLPDGSAIYGMVFHNYGSHTQAFAGMRNATTCVDSNGEIVGMVDSQKKGMGWHRCTDAGTTFIATGNENIVIRDVEIHGLKLQVRQTQCGVNCFILDSRRVLAPAPKVLGPKHISNPDFAPF